MNCASGAGGRSDSKTILTPCFDNDAERSSSTLNSASLGYDCTEEIAAYAPRILNVHVKDRLRGGTTVPLGTGAAELGKAIRLIESSGYAGQYILQTARAAGGDHAGALAQYRDMTVRWLEDSRR